MWVNKRGSRFAIAALALFGVMLGAAPSMAIGGKPAADRDTIIIAIGRDIAMLDAQVDNTGNSDRYAWQMFDNLYTFDKQGKLIPQVAKDVKVSDVGLDYRFTIRQDVIFHNGAKLTAEDVKFSFDRILDPATKSTRRPYFSDIIDRVEVIDPTTVNVKLRQRDVVFMNKVAAFVALVPKAYVESLPSAEAFARAPVGAGPYKLVSHKIGQSLELERHDAYYGAKPAIKRLVFRYIPDASSRLNALRAGEVDMADMIAPSDVKQIKESAGVSVVLVPAGSPLHIRLYSNVPNTPLADKRVRLALNYAIDVDAIIKHVQHGIGKPLTSFISAYYPVGVDPDLKPYPFDPKLARKLLADAGYPRGFETELLSPNSYPKDVTDAVAGYWQGIGVRAKTKVLDYPAWNRLNNTHASGPMTVMQYSNAIYDPITAIFGTAAKKGTWSDYSNPEVDALIEQTNSVDDPAERDKLFRKIARIMRDDGHAVLISELFSVFAMDSQIEWVPQQGYAFYDLRTIHWK